jgi:hypothetical protein
MKVGIDDEFIDFDCVRQRIYVRLYLEINILAVVAAKLICYRSFRPYGMAAHNHV